MASTPVDLHFEMGDGFSGRLASMAAAAHALGTVLVRRREQQAHPLDRIADLGSGEPQLWEGDGA